EEICRGFMSLAGVINSHTMAALIVLTNGTDEQRRRLLPRFPPAEAPPRPAAMSCFIAEKGQPGLQVVKSIAKLGYKGVDTAEIQFDQFPCPVNNLVGGIEGRGFRDL